MRRDLAGGIVKTAAVGRLTAAGLFFGEMNANPLPFQQGDCIQASARKKLVDDAGGKELHSGRAAHLVSIKLF